MHQAGRAQVASWRPEAPLGGLAAWNGPFDARARLADQFAVAWYTAIALLSRMRPSSRQTPRNETRSFANA